jgi:hypothetical protein
MPFVNQDGTIASEIWGMTVVRLILLNMRTVAFARMIAAIIMKDMLVLGGIVGVI